MTATLTINFEDGQSQVIELDHVVEIKVPTPSVEFAMNKSGKWTMRITTGLTGGKRLADVMMTAEKKHE